MPAIKKDFYYEAIIQDVIDGDTVLADLDLGCGVWLYRQRLRLARINAPERKAKKTDPDGPGEAAKMALGELIARNQGPKPGQILVQTIRDKNDKYGRLLVELIAAEGWPINDMLVTLGHAAYVK